MDAYNEELVKAGIRLDAQGLKPSKRRRPGRLRGRFHLGRRRPVHRVQGDRRRLLAVGGRQPGRGGRVGEALPHRPEVRQPAGRRGPSDCGSWRISAPRTSPRSPSRAKGWTRRTPDGSATDASRRSGGWSRRAWSPRWSDWSATSDWPKRSSRRCSWLPWSPGRPSGCRRIHGPGCCSRPGTRRSTSSAGNTPATPKYALLANDLRTPIASRIGHRRHRRRRPARPDLHRVPPGAAAGVPGRPHAAAARWADDRRDRAGLPGAVGDHRAADLAG